MPFWIELLICAFLLLGSLFALVGAIGLYRLPDFFTRLHAPTKATTLGVGGIIIASVIFFSVQKQGLSLHELLLTLFLFITAPVSAHMLSKAALQQGLPAMDKTRGRRWKDDGF
ncbi:Na+/H+ antiporter subunit G [Pseudomonas flexibilis]|uniref:Monovalent cation/H+ antiporter subunit G n=1 Tax=Pseudomonas flexibilis TaxID=706570 RepID=A0A0B3C3Z9_9PSED|nr:Na+/H+ antiporter subunit G [Pseudomonas flexibilis]KHL68518.1 cation:proton antiporter [Pseudomonas flexibilis]KHO66257.1 monovalent cation/H+ antiporter subunit G [Pseudomonas flexibilis]SCY46951.1 multicomponent K+:H+ antiporter subunit G [Pseudomonas flexibilis]SIQ96236.1 multisubunit potassium/proton antiporter, PhaG subunit [Pseudomonas flexibilis]